MQKCCNNLKSRIKCNHKGDLYARYQRYNSYGCKLKKTS